MPKDYWDKAHRQQIGREAAREEHKQRQREFLSKLASALKGKNKSHDEIVEALNAAARDTELSIDDVEWVLRFL